MPDEVIMAGTVAADMVVSRRSAQTFWTSFVTQTSPGAGRAGTQLGRLVGQGMTSPIQKAIAQGVTAGVRDAGTAALPAATRSGARIGNAMAKEIKARVAGAVKTLPNAKINVSVNDRGVVEKIGYARDLVEGLDGKRATAAIDVQANTAEAHAELDRVLSVARQVDRSDPTINVDADTGAAAAGLSSVAAEADRAGGSMSGLIAVAVGLAPAIVPTAAAASAALAGMGLAAVAGGAALGVTRLATAGVGDAVKALTTQQVSGGSAATSYASRQNQVASAADGVRSAEEALASAQRTAVQAQQALTTARQQAAQAMQDLANQVVDGTLSERDAELSLADAKLAVVTAQQQLTASEQALTAARKQQTTATAAVAAAQQNLATAQASHDPTKITAAQQALTAAQQTQAKAVAGVTAAQTDLAKAQLDVQRAQLQVEQATQRLREQRLENQRLAAQERATAKAGVEGSAQVVAAKQRIVDADQAVGDAERRVAAAQRSLAAAYASSSAAGAAGVDQVAQAMDNLSPAGRRFATFVAGTLYPRLLQLRATAQAGLLPGVQAGITSLLPLFVTLNALVGAVATTLGGLAAQAGRALAGPWWQQFFATVSAQIVPALRVMAGILGNAAVGAAGLFQAVIPLAVQFGQSMFTLSQRWADFGRNAKDNPQVRAFLDYAAQALPTVNRLFGDLATIGGHLVVGLAPLGGGILTGIQGITSAISSIPAGTLAGIATAIAGLVVGFKLLAVSSPLGRVVTILAAIITGAGTASGALGGFLKTLGQTLGPVVTLLSGTLTRALAILQPAINGLLAALGPVIGRLVGQLARTLVPVIILVARTLAALLPVISPIVSALAGALVPVVGVFASALRQILPVLTPLITLIGGALAQVIQLVAPYLRQFATVLARDLAAGVRTLAPLFPVLVTAVLAVVRAVLPLVGIILQLATQLLPVMLPLWQQLVQVLVLLLPTILQLAATIITAWMPVLQALMPVIVQLVGLLAGALTVALRDVVVPLLTYVVVPALTAVGRAITWLVSSIVLPLVRAWVGAFTWAVNTIFKPVLGWLDRFLRATLVPAFQFLGRAGSAAWRTLSSGIKSGYDWMRTNVFSPLASIFTKTLPNAVRTGTSWIGTAWAKLQDYARTPVRFVVRTVLENGLLAGFNFIASKVGVKTRLHMPKDVLKLATGGPVVGPGGPRADKIPAMLSNGEYVLNAATVRRLGVGFLDQLNGLGLRKPGVRQPGDGSQGVAFRQHFADGGLVGWLKGAWKTVSNPAGAIRDRANGLLKDIPGTGIVRDLASHTASSLIGGVMSRVSDMLSIGGGSGYGGPITESIRSVWSFIKAQNHKPYIWASAGPRGYDCSGLVSAVYNYAHGRNPYRHTFSTMNEAGFFPKPGQGLFTAGWANPGERGGGSVGHTAGNYAGLAFESGGAGGDTHWGSGSTPVTSFAHIGHYADGGLIRKYDSGGYIPPGLSMVYNGLGRPEAVFTPDQLRALRQSRQGGGDRTFNIYPQRADFGLRDLEQVEYARSLVQREGRRP